MRDLIAGQTYVANAYENVDWFVSHVRALHCLGVRVLILFGELYRNRENPEPGPTYIWEFPDKIHAAVTAAQSWGMTYAVYLHGRKWADSGGTIEQACEHVRLQGGGAFLDGAQISPSADVQRKFTNEMRKVTDGHGPLIGHYSLEYHQRKNYPQCADCCNYVLIGEQPTFVDWKDPELKKTHRPWFRTLIKWPTLGGVVHPLNLDGSGYLRWVADGGALFLHQGAQIREWSTYLQFDRGVTY